MRFVNVRNVYPRLEFEVLTAVKISTVVFWIVAGLHYVTI
jgi:hypothetical protein